MDAFTGEIDTFEVGSPEHLSIWKLMSPVDEQKFQIHQPLIPDGKSFMRTRLFWFYFKTACLFECVCMCVFSAVKGI